MQIFLDADGVLADFDKYASALFGVPVSITNQVDLIPGFWDTIYEHNDFYYNLPLLADAQRLFDAVKHKNPIILTGLPKLNQGNWADGQKRRWVEKHFPGTPVITCLSEDKCKHMKGKGDILVDDWTKYQSLWEYSGGIFVHHTSTDNTLVRLKELKAIE
jgi:hypothetical protein